MKLENCGEIDFFQQDIACPVKCNSSSEFMDILDDAEKTGKSFDLDFDESNSGRDGCFDEDQLFAIWEPNDIRQLIERLQSCLP